MKTPRLWKWHLIVWFFILYKTNQTHCWLDSTEMWSLLYAVHKETLSFYILEPKNPGAPRFLKVSSSSEKLVSKIGHSIPSVSLRGTSCVVAQSAEELSIRNLGSNSDFAPYYLCDLLHDIDLSRPLLLHMLNKGDDRTCLLEVFLALNETTLLLGLAIHLKQQFSNFLFCLRTLLNSWICCVYVGYIYLYVSS